MIFYPQRVENVKICIFCVVDPFMSVMQLGENQITVMLILDLQRYLNNFSNKEITCDLNNSTIKSIGFADCGGDFLTTITATL
jgi:hypothetical protein